MRIYFFIITFTAFSFLIKGQNNIEIHSESIDSLFSWFDSKCPENRIRSLLAIPSNQIMEQLLLKQEKEASSFSDILSRFSIKCSLAGNDYLLEDAFKNRQEISAVLTELKDVEIYKQTFDYVKAFFPAGFTSSARFNIYLTTTGWKWGDAMTFNYVKEGGKYLLSEKGASAIIFNLTIMNSNYGKTVEEQIITYRKVLSHELFHAILEEYIVDKDYYNRDQIESEVIFLLMNEGVAHYIADQKYIANNYDTLKEKEVLSFSSFSEKAAIIFDRNNDMEIRKTVLEDGLYGKYWSKYICISGMFMAYHIDKYGGPDLLRECIENGPHFFIEKYREICNTNDSLPLLPNIINE
ncbi:DUF5700 domain-containing putative Zn-dependent protease [Dysgonomonas macrotermitis]|uniref:Uncharacterized protein n=1 Tax=Dysgonomonas macrotermitis TaxID=1346286 RepID=A0A1M4UGF9_9BACT|nr:DUF5700 domain-containing putative Zn-dependent protease [Dysgonomonas macrotermitis]SHE55718.1 hypothetical protein SAMN05444362_101593 [Dysgonomonas macrotermitis]